MANKLTGFIDALAKIAKPGELPILEMDAAAQEVTEEFLRVWLTARIRHNKAMNRQIKDDKIYGEVVGYMVELNSAFFFPRMWTAAGIKETITRPLDENQDLLEFVYRGGATLYAKIFGKSTDAANQSFQGLTKHLCDSLCLMSSNNEHNLINEGHRSVFPTYTETLALFTHNPWLVFIYYLCRVDIFELVTAEKGAVK